MPLISSETDACDDRCQRTLHRTRPRPGLDGPLGWSRGPDGDGHLQQHGVPDAAALQGPCQASHVRRAARCRPCAGGYRPRQRLVPLRCFAVCRPCGPPCSLRGRCGTGAAARSRRGTRLDARRSLRGVRPSNPQRPGPCPCPPAPACEPAAGRAGAGAGAPGTHACTAGYTRRLLLTHRSTCRGRDPATPPFTPHVTRWKPGPPPRTGTGALNEPDSDGGVADPPRH